MLQFNQEVGFIESERCYL